MPTSAIPEARVGFPAWEGDFSEIEGNKGGKRRGEGPGGSSGRVQAVEVRGDAKVWVQILGDEATLATASGGSIRERSARLGM